MRITIHILSIFLLLPVIGFSQDFVMVTANRELYAIDVENCNSTFIVTVQSPGNASVGDLTYTPDGMLWGVGVDARLYTINETTGATNLFTTFPNSGELFTSLVSDASGLLYTADEDGDLYTYDPATNTTIYLGDVGPGAAGDLTFYNGQLMMATVNNTMIAIDPDNATNPEFVLSFNVASSIFGIVTFAEDCENTVTYATSGGGQVFEIDFDNNTLTELCNFFTSSYGAASTLEFLAADPIQVEAVNVSGTSCADPEGSIEIIATGSSSIQYSLDGENFQDSNVFTGLEPGLYTIYMIDDNNCMEEVMVEIVSTDDSPTISQTITTSASCGAANGSIMIIAEGGNPPYQYSLDGGVLVNDGTFINLLAGTYVLMVEDAIGCTDVISIELEGTPALEISTIDVSSCGGMDNSLTISAIGGNDDYQYSINGGAFQSSNVFETLTSGTYSVEVQDSDGCMDSETVEIPVVAPLTVDLESILACGENESFITVTASGGNGGYQYSINGGTPQTEGVFTNLSPGDYSIVAIDEDGCNSEMITVEMPAIDPIAVETITVSATCGAANGSITAMTEGGTPPYQYSLDEGALVDEGVFVNLLAGTYVLTIEDAIGCTEVISVELEGTPALELNAIDVLSCGGMDNSLTISAMGGNESYQYSINGGSFQSGNVFETLISGTYLVEVQDSDGCMDSETIEIPAVDPLIVTMESILACGENENFITVAASGGNGGYQYSINGGAPQAEGTFTSLSPGNYSIIAIDEDGCNSEMITVEMPAIDPITVENETIEIDQCSKSTGSIDLETLGGTPPYNYTLNGQAVGIPPLNNLTGGGYLLEITDAVGCIYTDSLQIPSICPIYLPNAFTPNDDGRNDHFALYSGVPIEILEYQIFNRWGGLVYEATAFTSYETALFWDGTREGTLLNPGVYAYYIKVINASGIEEIFKGDVHLVK
ncbi:MAG: gliding motility-associated C-terminal domain-containing protein [Chitinophagales bacterium]|nr:gliding motility-associated C-terminal domain-containing protein [Chitinophagales bacterium]